MFTRSQFLIGVAAGIGGIAPNLVNLAQGFTGRTPEVPGWLYWVGVGIFFLLGAAVALIFSETTHSKAFFLGVSLPAFIAAAQTHQGREIPVATPAGPATSLLWFVGEAYAQQPQWPAPVNPKTEEKDHRTLTVQPLQPCKQCELWFYNQQGNLLDKKYIPNLEEEVTVVVPPGATKFGIWNKKINPKLWVLPTDPKVDPHYSFTYDYSIWNDLKRGLGDYSVRQYDPNLQLAPGTRPQ